ncbi:MAG: hemerythrin-like metal-binding protein [Variovorax sp.]|nr:hemerythrin-like metal-binding protein [Variovorax sp.]
MAASQCSQALSLDLPFMDQDHDAFVERLSAVDAADDERLPEAWRALVVCTTGNFERENRWMQTSGYAARKEHAVQHRVVLEVMREGLQQAGEGRLLQVREMARQLRSWYTKHVQSMDAALALHLRGLRFDPADDRACVPGAVR